MSFELSSTAIGVERVGRRRLVGRALLYGAAAGVFVFPLVAALLDLGPLWVLLGVVAPLVAMAKGMHQLAGAWTTAEERRGAPGHLTVRGDELAVDVAGREWVLALPPLDGWREESRDARRVVLRFPGEVLVEVAVDDAEAALALLDAVGASAAQRAVRLVLPRATRATRRTAGCATLVLVVFGSALPIGTAIAFASEAAPGDMRGVLALLTLAWGVSLFALAVPALDTRLIIGTDGLEVRRALGRRRFVPFAALASVRRVGRRLELGLRTGGAVVIPTASPSDARSARLAVSAARRVARDAERVTAERLRPLERGALSEAAWRSALRALGTGGGAAGAVYRVRALTPRDLGDVVDNPAAAPHHRVAAAYALACGAEPALMARVRVAVDTCADPLLRAALERAQAAELDAATVAALAARHADADP